MPKPTQLIIPKPCQQSWTDMTPADRGRYCTACAQTVADMAQMTDTQILQWIEQSAGGRICGRLHPSQLNRDMTSSHPRTQRRWWSVLAGLGLALSTEQVVASPPSSPSAVTADAPWSVQQRKEQALQRDTLPTPLDSLQRTIQGRLMEAETQEALIYAPVTIKGVPTGTTTDFDGFFSIEVPENCLNKPIDLEVTYIGFATQVIQIAPHQLPVRDLLVMMALDGTLVGEIVIIQPRWWQFWKPRYRPY